MKKKYLIYSLVATLVLTSTIALVAWRRKAATIAAAFINEMEIGNNSGFADAAFQQMMTDVGWLGGEAWCMYFDKAVYIQAFPKKADIIRQYFTGSTQQTWKNAQAHPEYFKVITDGLPQVGDIIIWQNIKNPSTGHAGIALKKDQNKYYYTVEGNSGLGGTSEGQGVTTQHRLLIPGTVEGSLKLLGFIRMKL